MKVAVCIKQVPVVSMLRFDNESRRLVREGVPSEVNPFDVIALSAVVGLKHSMPVEAVAITMGPSHAREALVQCLATGVDRAIHLVDQAFAGSDTLATARALALAIRREEFDLVVCGLNSVDAETGQVGPEIAELLGLPLVTAVRGLQVSDSGAGITAERLTDEGYEEVYCPLPALITVTEGIAPEVYPDRAAMEAASDEPIVEVSAAGLSSDGRIFGVDGSPTSVGEIYSVETNRGGIVLRDEPIEDAVGRLVEYLEGRGVFSEGATGESTGHLRGPRRRAGPSGPIWVVAELLAGEMRAVTLELLGRASELSESLGTCVETVLLGHDVGEHVAPLTAHGADRVHLADDPRLALFDVEVHAAALAGAIKSNRPYAVLFPSTGNGRDLAARLAARLDLGLTGDCVGLEIDAEGRLVQLKPAFGGSIVAPILSRTTPQMATVRPGILQAAVPDFTVEPEIVALKFYALPAPRVRVLERVVDASAQGAELEHARVVVAIGKGIGGPQNLGVVRELADVLGASIGATRDVTELGWLPRQQQIGLSGKSVAPELYVAIGVRGPFNHTVGIRRAGTVVAVNNSARAPIFKASDFGIVGDFAEVVPALSRALRGRSGGRGP